MIPLFKSHFSIGKSILTLSDPEKQKEDGPDSIFSILKDNGLKDLYLIEDCLTGFLTAFKLCQKFNIHLKFGLRVSICNNYESTETSTSKIVLFALNDTGFKDINKIYTFAHTQHDGVISNDDLASRMTDNILIAVPFYDSYIWNNSFYFKDCYPSFLEKFDHLYFIEDNKLPFDGVVAGIIQSKQKQTVWAKSIYYKNREDYDAWVTYKIACNRNMGKNQSLSAPELNGCGSKEFCFESWKEMS